jgi:hypothetical protein
VTFFDLIDFRSFSTIWYWLLVGLIWTRTINAPAGVPIDVLRAAERGVPQAVMDCTALCRIELGRRAHQSPQAAALRVGLWSFVLAALVMGALLYRIEIAQALLLLAAPLALVTAMVTRTAARLVSTRASATEMRRRLIRLKLMVQGVGMVSVFVTAVWGMISNLAQAMP